VRYPNSCSSLVVAIFWSKTRDSTSFAASTSGAIVGSKIIEDMITATAIAFGVLVLGHPIPSYYRTQLPHSATYLPKAHSGNNELSLGT
jgi:hypothetical protein